MRIRVNGSTVAIDKLLNIACRDDVVLLASEEKRYDLRELEEYAKVLRKIEESVRDKPGSVLAVILENLDKVRRVIGDALLSNLVAYSAMDSGKRLFQILSRLCGGRET